MKHGDLGTEELFPVAKGKMDQSCSVALRGEGGPDDGSYEEPDLGSEALVDETGCPFS